LVVARASSFQYTSQFNGLSIKGLRVRFHVLVTFQSKGFQTFQVCNLKKYTQGLPFENTLFLHPLATPNKSQRREKDFRGTPDVRSEIKKTRHPTKDIGYSVAHGMNTNKW
jgi:hypothetical protein